MIFPQIERSRTADLVLVVANSTATESLQTTDYTVQDGYHELFVAAAIWICVWVTLFYALSATFPYWISHVDPSTKPHENDRYWCARNVLGIVHAILIILLSVPSMLVLVFEGGHDVQFAFSNHVATCSVMEGHPEQVEYRLWLQAIAAGGLAFTTFTLVDIFISLGHGLASADYIIHHIAFVTAGIIIRGYCMLPLTASILMAMEVSTPFLNWLMFFRHRGEKYKFQVVISGSCFFATFLLFRVFLNTYGTVVLLISEANGTALPAKVDQWQTIFLMVAVTAGALVQFYWLPGICYAFGTNLWALLTTGTTAKDELSKPQLDEE